MDNDGFTALAYAVKEDDLESSKRLIAMGGDPNAIIGRQKIPLLAIAVISRSKESVKYLIANGADANAKVREDVSILDLAVGLGYSEIVEVLNNTSGKHV